MKEYIERNALIAELKHDLYNDINMYGSHTEKEIRDDKIYFAIDALESAPVADVIEGKVTEAKHVYQRITYVKPIEYHYEDEGDEPYIKYGCPVCKLLGNTHQIAKGKENCPLCNVNLLWDIKKERL